MIRNHRHIRNGFLLLALVAHNLHAQAPDSGALPQGGQVVAGQASISQQTNQMDINQTSQQAILNWQQFNIGSDASVNFHQPGADSVSLNRVLGSDPSAIYGNLNANGQVFLVNPNGTLFADGASVDVGGLVASSLNLGNQAFLNGDYLFENGGTAGSIQNLGNISADYIALLAPEVINMGVISARLGTAALVAGDSIRLNLTGNNLIDIEVEQANFDTLVENRHLINAEGGQVIMSAQSANGLLGQVVNTGRVEAQGMVSDGGVIRLMASDSIELGGSLNADAASNGDGGSIIAIADLENADSSTQVTGSVSAQGGSVSGDGGFIETSATNLSIADSAQINTSASNGQTGEWLLDPTDFTVALSGGDVTGAALSTLLGSNNITIQSGTGTNDTNNFFGASGTAGDIFVNDAISWSANTLFTIDAGHDIWLNAPIAASGGVGSGVALQFGQDLASGDFANSAQLFLRSPISLTSSSSFSTLFGNDGTVTDYTVIADAAGLANVSTGLADDYVLGTDITLAGEWAPLGNGVGTVFDGIFNGLGHSVSGLTTTNTTNQQFVGLFGSIGMNGVVENLGVVGANVAGALNVGALAGENNGLILSSYSTGTVTGSDVVGATNDSTVGAIGGLVGLNNGGIALSYSSADVTATTGSQLGGGFGGGGAIGGLVGDHQGLTIDNAYATGDVTGGTDVGGLVGYQASGIGFSYATGAVTGDANLGGLVGTLDAAIGGFAPDLLSDTFWDTQTSGQATSGSAGTNSSTGLTTAQSQQEASYANWDFTDTWVIREGSSYPLLRTFLPPLVVAADNQSKDFDGNIFGGTYTGTLSNGVQLNDGDGATGLIGTLAFSGTSQAATDAGDYVITPSGLSLADSTDQHGYLNVAFVDGELSINALLLEVITTELQGFVFRRYDGTNAATLTSDNFLLSGFLDDDGATVTETVGTFASSNVNADLEVGQTVSVTLDLSDYSATGDTDLNNYSLPVGVIQGDVGFVLPKEITTTTGLTVDNREYDSTTDATVSGPATPTFNGAGCGAEDDGMACAGDLGNLALDISGANAVYDNANVTFVDNEVTVTELALTGSAASNYILATEIALDGTGTITTRPIDIVSADEIETLVKEYDGTTAFPDLDLDQLLSFYESVFNLDIDLSGTSELRNPTSWGFIEGESALPGIEGAVYTDPNANTSVPIRFEWSSWLAVGDTSLSNYDLPSFFEADIGRIDPMPIAVTLTEDAQLSRVYDGTVDANALEIGAFLTDIENWGFAPGEDARSFFTAEYESDDVGTENLIVSYLGWVPQNGDTNPDNYVFPDSQNFAIGEITPLAISVSDQMGVDRIYDATTNVAVSGGTLTGVLDGDVVSAGTGVGTIASPNVDTDIPITITSTDLEGEDGGNYLVTEFTTGVTMDITPATVNFLPFDTIERVYDGTSFVSVPGELEGVFQADRDRLVASAGSGSFQEIEIGVPGPGWARTYTDANVIFEAIDPVLSRDAASNYVLGNIDNGEDNYWGFAPLTITITPKDLDVQGLLVDSRTYDGTTGGVTFDGSSLSLLTLVPEFESDDQDGRPIEGDLDFLDIGLGSVTGEFASANVGTSVGVTLIGALEFTDPDVEGTAASYRLILPEGITGEITEALLTITANDQTKKEGFALTFDGNEFTVDGLFDPDSVTSATLESRGAAVSAFGDTFPIQISDAEGVGLSNYDITYIEGELKLEQATLSDVIGQLIAGLRLAGAFAEGSTSTTESYMYYGSTTYVSNTAATDEQLTALRVSPVLNSLLKIADVQEGMSILGSILGNAISGDAISIAFGTDSDMAAMEATYLNALGGGKDYFMSEEELATTASTTRLALLSAANTIRQVCTQCNMSLIDIWFTRGIFTQVEDSDLGD